MILYVKTGPRSFRPATEGEILSAYGSLMAGRRKTVAAGSFAPKLSEQDKERIRQALSAAPRRTAEAARLATEYGVSTRTIWRALGG